MKVTESAWVAAWVRYREMTFDNYDRSEREMVEELIKMAFAAVPDPLELAENWERQARRRRDIDSVDRGVSLKFHASELRAFMRGDDK